MKLSINFLQAGGVPLTADLMDNIMESIKFYDFIGELAGNLTILSGCVVTGSSISSGVVAINGECYFLEAGLITSTVYINTQQITKTFQDQTDKILIEKKSVKFGTSTPQNTFNWADFFRLDTLKAMQEKISKAALQTDLVALEKRVAKVELKTAPIVNGGIVWIWKLPVSDIPIGWKECTDLRGKTVFGRDPNDPTFQNAGNTIGNKTKTIQKVNLPNITLSYEDIQPGTPDWGFGGFDGGNNKFTKNTKQTSALGSGTPMDVLNPGRIVDFIEPDLPF